MADITLITGGQRSGKSSYAQSMVESMTDKPIYLATARHWDDDFEKRIKRHQSDRGEQWRTIEKEKELGSLHLNGEIVLLDLVMLWLNSIFHDNNYDLNKSLDEAKADWDIFAKNNFTLIVVSNEIGMCLHAPDQISRHFTDLQGWVNQHIAKQATKVFTMISGIPLQIK